MEATDNSSKILNHPTLRVLPTSAAEQKTGRRAFVELIQQLRTLERKVQQISAAESSPNRGFRQLLQVYRSLIKFDSLGTAGLSDLSGVLLRLYAPRAVCRIAQRLAGEFLRQEENFFRTPVRRVDLDHLCADMLFLLRWYRVRKRTLLIAALSSVNFEQGSLFGAGIEPDVTRFGVPGTRIFSSAFLLGVDEIPHWFRVRVFWNGQPVLVHSGWESWTGSTNALQLVGDQERGVFTALSPVLPEMQMQVVDYVDLFIPTDALELPAGTHQVVFRGELVGEREEVLDTFDIETALSGASSQVPQSGIPVSPQVSGLWPRDPVKRDSIHHLDLQWSYTPRRGWDVPDILLESEVTVTGENYSPVTVEIRIRTEPLKNPGEEPVIRKMIFPTRPYQRILLQEALQIQSFFQGDHQQAFYTVELSLSSESGMVLCGTQEPVESRFRHLPGSQEFALSGEHAPTISQLRQSSLELGGRRYLSVSFSAKGIFPQKEVVRAFCSLSYDSTFCDRQITKSFLCIGEGEDNSFSGVFLFDQGELESIGSMDERDGSRVYYALSLAFPGGDPVATEKGECNSMLFLSDQEGYGKKPHGLFSDSFSLVGLSLFRQGNSGRSLLQVTANIGSSKNTDQRILLYIEPLDESGNSLQCSSGSLSRELPGYLEDVHIRNPQISAEKYVSGIFQHQFLVPVELKQSLFPMRKKNIAAIRLMVFSESGRLLSESFHSSAELAGVQYPFGVDESSDLAHLIEAKASPR